MKLIRLAFVFFSMSSICVGQSVRDIARVAFKSVVLLEMNDSNGQPLSLGSGFFIANGIIATNAHVIEGASSGTAKLIGETRTMQILGTVAIDRHSDLALLKVDSSAPALILSTSAYPSVGDNVYVVGNPLGLEGTFSTGIISGIRRIDADSILQMTAPISPGSSGGPVMDSSGSVIGISVATFKDGQNLNLAVPVNYLSKLLASPSKDIISLRSEKKSDQNEKSMLDVVGTNAEKGVTVSGYHIDGNSDITEGEYQFRLTNKLPVTIYKINLRILYYDESGSLMDFEDIIYPDYIPAGLTKTIRNSSKVSLNAAYYYHDNVLPILPKGMYPKVEIRVRGYLTEKSE